MAYFTGKGYGVSKHTDIQGIPLLSYTFPDTGKTITLFDRIATQVDPTIKQTLTLSQIYGSRMDAATSGALKKAIGGVSGQELDHIISLELGGSNQIANLGLDTTPQVSGNNATDTYENQLSAAVQAGSMSLLDAWRAIAKSKGKVLAEDLTVETNDNWATAAESVFGALKGILGIGQIGSINKNLQAQVQQDADTLAKTPYDLPTRTKIFTEQIDLTSEQLNLSKTDAAAYVKVYTARYAQSQGVDPRELIGALTANEQQLINISTSTPNVLGINNVVWTNVAGALTAGSAALMTVSLIAAVIAFFTAGPEVLAGLAGGGSFASLLSLFGISNAAVVAAAAFGLAEFLNQIAIRIPMITKQMYDNGSLFPTQVASALSEDIKNLKTGSAGTSSSSGSSNTPAYPPGVGAPSSVSNSSVSGTGVHVSVVSGGVLGSPATFTPADKSVFESMDELQAAAEENLARYVGALPGQLAYELKLTHKIVLADGTVRIGTTQTVLHGYTKGSSKAPPRPEYKKITNKFVVADVYYTPLAGGRKKLDEIVIGAVDETGFRPTAEDLAGLGDAIASYLVSNQLGGVTQINLPSSGAAPASKPSPSPSTVPTTTAQIAPVAAPAATPPPATPPPPAPVITPSPPAPDYSGLTEAEAALARAQGPSSSAWNTAPQVSRDAWKRDFDNQLVATAAAAAAAPALPAQTPAPIAAPMGATTHPAAPANVRYANGYIYNLPAAGGFYSGPIADAPPAALGTLFQQLGLGSSSMFAATAGQIAAIESALG